MPLRRPEPTKPQTEIVFTGMVPTPSPQQTKPGVHLSESEMSVNIDADGDLRICTNVDQDVPFIGSAECYVKLKDLPALLDLMLHLQPWIETLR